MFDRSLPGACPIPQPDNVPRGYSQRSLPSLGPRASARATESPGPHLARRRRPTASWSAARDLREPARSGPGPGASRLLPVSIRFDPIPDPLTSALRSAGPTHCQAVNIVQTTQTTLDLSKELHGWQRPPSCRACLRPGPRTLRARPRQQDCAPASWPPSHLDA